MEKKICECTQGELAKKNSRTDYLSNPTFPSLLQQILKKSIIKFTESLQEAVEKHTLNIKKIFNSNERALNPIATE